jgi:UDP-N-acetylmuramate: L-alanyl-gamma-D-glutamyl-meso-diaminopimelate ligase
VVIDDFAHHPTAVEKTLASMRMRFPGRRLLACFEPRSLTAGRAFLLAGYARAFALADRAFFAPIFHRDRLAPEDRLDLEALAETATLDAFVGGRPRDFSQGARRRSRRHQR